MWKWSGELSYSRLFPPVQKPGGPFANVYLIWGRLYAKGLKTAVAAAAAVWVCSSWHESLRAHRQTRGVAINVNFQQPDNCIVVVILCCDFSSLCQFKWFCPMFFNVWCCVCTEADLDTAQISGNTRPKGFYFSLCVVITKKTKQYFLGLQRRYTLYWILPFI